MARRGNLEVAIGAVIRERRLQRGLSQEALAEAADLHRNYVGLVERGQHSASLAALAAIAGALGLKASELIRLAETGQLAERT
ncbi:MAG: helix-turn-helix transcriptional regulator [Dehalococcoidia bacterium]|nr:helix-turn-helix transcriptional regulator [Dehalococcoidia bacterium]